MLVLRILMRIQCQREEPVWCLGGRTHDHHINCLNPRNPIINIRMCKSHPGQQGEAAALPGTGVTAPCNTNVNERQLQPMEHPEKKNKHTTVLPSPSDLVFWEYTGTLTALYVTLCKSKSLYQRKHWWMDSSNSQAEFMQRAPLADNMFCIFWTICRQLLQISPTLLHLGTFTYSLEIKI